MKKREKVVLSWSGGKDSAVALHEIRKSRKYEIVSLLTSVADEYRRISHHGVREELVEQQAEAIGVPLHKVYLPADSSHPCTNEVYEELMEQVLLKYKEAGVLKVAFGDIFLEDLREYRERNLAKVGMTGVFPIWHRDTAELVQTAIRMGFKAYLSCVEGKLGRAFVGRAFDENLIRDLPEGVDPCGEYGEYHSFVYDGPIFKKPVGVRVGKIVLRDGRHYADLLPVDSPRPQAPEEPRIPPVGQTT